MAGKLLETEIAFRGTVPDDIAATGVRGRQTQFFDPLVVRDRETGDPLDNNAILKYLLKNSEIDISLRTLGQAFFPRVIAIGTTPSEIIPPNRYPRGYILMNANITISGIVGQVTVFPVGTVWPVGVTNSIPVNVSGYGGASFYMDVTEASAGNGSVDLQSQDPLSGNWVTVQSDIFNFGPGPIAVGTYHANVGPLGIDNSARLVVTIAGDTATGSIVALLKPALAGNVSGGAVFLGGPDVNTTIGFPLLAGSRESIYMKENSSLYGVAVAATSLNLFELQ